MSPEEMMTLVLSGSEQDFSQELWKAFLNGFPMDNLQKLLRSEEAEVLNLGVYLVYELGARARCLIDDIVPILNNDDAQNRGSVIIALQECVTKFDEVVLGKLVEGLADYDPFVQRMAMGFVQSCDRGLLDIGVHKAANDNPNSVFSEFPECLVKRIFRMYRVMPISKEVLVKLASHENPIANRFGAGLAARPRMIVDEGFLDLINPDDEECRSLAASARQQMSSTYAEVMRLEM